MNYAVCNVAQDKRHGHKTNELVYIYSMEGNGFLNYNQEEISAPIKISHGPTKPTPFYIRILNRNGGMTLGVKPFIDFNFSGSKVLTIDENDNLVIDDFNGTDNQLFYVVLISAKIVKIQAKDACLNVNNSHHDIKTSTCKLSVENNFELFKLFGESEINEHSKDDGINDPIIHDSSIDNDRCSRYIRERGCTCPKHSDKDIKIRKIDEESEANDNTDNFHENNAENRYDFLTPPKNINNNHRYFNDLNNDNSKINDGSYLASRNDISNLKHHNFDNCKIKNMGHNIEDSNDKSNFTDQIFDDRKFDNSGHNIDDYIDRSNLTHHKFDSRKIYNQDHDIDHSKQDNHCRKNEQKIYNDNYIKEDKHFVCAKNGSIYPTDPLCNDDEIVDKLHEISRLSPIPVHL
ncbi:hypothetical protein COBT_001015 [Conglomerata obtusa]